MRIRTTKVVRLAAATLLGAGVLGVGAAEPASADHCDISGSSPGVVVTGHHSPFGPFVDGTTGADLIVASAGCGFVRGFGGNDQIVVKGDALIDAGDGDDRICAGNGVPNSGTGGAGNNVAVIDADDWIASATTAVGRCT